MTNATSSRPPVPITPAIRRSVRDHPEPLLSVASKGTADKGADGATGVSPGTTGTGVAVGFGVAVGIGVGVLVGASCSLGADSRSVL